MSNKLITEMSSEEFAQIIDAFITRETRSIGEVETLLFYDALDPTHFKCTKIFFVNAEVEPQLSLANKQKPVGETCPS